MVDRIYNFSPPHVVIYKTLDPANMLERGYIPDERTNSSRISQSARRLMP